MSIKLIAVDLDGTLLNSEQKITAKTKAALQKAAASGILVVPCSGRPFPGVKEYIDELGLANDHQYAVTFNGALVFNLKGDIVVKELLHYQDLTYFYKIRQQHQTQFHFELEDRFITMERFINYMMSRESWLTRMPIQIKDFADIDQNIEFTKAMFSGQPDEIANFLQILPAELFEKYNVSTSDPTLIEINSPQASKGNALLDLAKTLDLDPSEVMIFGDQRNDISMFKIPQFKKIAMGNAITEVKNLADFVTKSNDEDGIAYAIDKYIFN